MKREELEIKIAGAMGRGEFARRRLKKGGLVVCGKPVKGALFRTDYSFQVDKEKHVDLDEPARLINHSCNPNLGIASNEFGGYNFIAMRNIKAGDEITWDYCMSEYESIAIKNRCLCGSKICRGKISGYQALPKKIRKKYNNFIADYIRKI